MSFPAADMMSFCNYLYEDGKVINAQADWTLEGDYGFDMQFRVNFEKGNVVFKGDSLQVNVNEGKGFSPELSQKWAIITNLNILLKHYFR